jgi:hypothetical protein
MKATEITNVNIYQVEESGDWYYAAFAGAEYDECSEVDVPWDATEDEARAEMRKVYPGAVINRVEDIGLRG